MTWYYPLIDHPSGDYSRPKLKKIGLKPKESNEGREREPAVGNEGRRSKEWPMMLIEQDRIQEVNDGCEQIAPYGGRPIEREIEAKDHKGPSGCLCFTPPDVFKLVSLASCERFTRARNSHSGTFAKLDKQIFRGSHLLTYSRRWAGACVSN
mmetsp:Transcript_25485/g.30938  ORF Transcript_25485/g.30938 Transcript_25485/m.30938 type:complete len:152 (-) Transcript_25485:467-922(-)